MLRSRLIALCSEASQASVNPVAGIVSDDNDIGDGDGGNDECQVGLLVSGITLKG